MHPSIKKNLIEKLAELEHSQWMHWAGGLIQQGKITEGIAIEWSQFMVPYEELDEDAKEIDRMWAKRVIDIVEKVIV